LFLSGCELDFAKTLISLYVLRIQSNGAIGIIDRLVRFLEVLRINERQLLIRFGVVWVCFDCVFQDVNRLWKIFLLYQQNGHPRRELRLAGVDIEHFSVRLQRFIHLACLLESHSLNEMRERAGFAFALRTQNQVRRRLETQ
jgi:hypothetical protein